MAVRAVPEGYHTVTPYLVVRGADQVIKFVEAAFGAKVETCVKRDDGQIWHADIQIGDSHVMISEGTEQFPPSTTGVHLYVEDCDGVYAKALKAGGVSIMEPANQFYGDRSGGVRDSAGNFWWISTHVADVSPEELDRRRAEATKTASA